MTTKRSYSFRNEARSLLNDETVSDVCFLVGDDQTKIHANRNILAVGSDVFRRMFYGDLKESAFQIVIPDCSPVGLMNVFRYIYGYDMDFELDDLCETIMAGDKYLVHNFTEAALKYVEDRLTVANCCLLYDQLLKLQFQPPVLRRIVRLIQEHSQEAFSSESFGRIDQPTLISILELPRLAVKEIDIVRFCSRWTDVQVEQLELPATRENKQEIFELAKYFVRFDRIPPAEIAKCKEIHNLLSDEEVRQLRTRQLDGPLPFDCQTNRVAFVEKLAVQPLMNPQPSAPPENRRVTRSMSVQMLNSNQRPNRLPYRAPNNLPNDPPPGRCWSSCVLELLCVNSQFVMFFVFIAFVLFWVMFWVNSRLKIGLDDQK